MTGLHEKPRTPRELAAWFEGLAQLRRSVYARLVMARAPNAKLSLAGRRYAVADVEVTENQQLYKPMSDARWDRLALIAAQRATQAWS